MFSWATQEERSGIADGVLTTIRVKPEVQRHKPCLAAVPVTGAGRRGNAFAVAGSVLTGWNGLAVWGSVPDSTGSARDCQQEMLFR